MPNLLLIEDDPAVRDMLRSALGIGGYEVTTAVDGALGVALAQERAFDVVLTDLVMPRMHGTETIARLRRLLPFARIVAMTGYASPLVADGPADAGTVGADALLLKPFRLDELREALASRAKPARRRNAPRRPAEVKPRDAGSKPEGRRGAPSRAG